MPVSRRSIACPVAVVARVDVRAPPAGRLTQSWTAAGRSADGSHRR
jgi:hypothetical protein